MTDETRVVEIPALIEAAREALERIQSYYVEGERYGYPPIVHKLRDALAGVTSNVACPSDAETIATKDARIAALEADLSAARQSLYEVAAQRNELHAILEKHSINAERQ